LLVTLDLEQSDNLTNCQYTVPAAYQAPNARTPTLLTYAPSTRTNTTTEMP